MSKGRKVFISIFILILSQCYMAIYAEPYVHPAITVDSNVVVVYTIYKEYDILYPHSVLGDVCCRINYNTAYTEIVHVYKDPSPPRNTILWVDNGKTYR